MSDVHESAGVAGSGPVEVSRITLEEKSRVMKVKQGNPSSIRNLHRACINKHRELEIVAEDFQYDAELVLDSKFYLGEHSAARRMAYKHADLLAERRKTCSVSRLGAHIVKVRRMKLLRAAIVKYEDPNTDYKHSADTRDLGINAI